MNTKNLFLSIVLLSCVAAEAQPFCFDIEEAINNINDTDYYFTPSFDKLGVNITKNKVRLNFIGIKDKEILSSSNFKKADCFYNEDEMKYYFQFYDKYGDDNYELNFYDNFEKAELKFEWDKTTNLFKSIIYLKRNQEFLKKPNDDFKTLPGYIRKQIKLEAKIVSGLVLN